MFAFTSFGAKIDKSINKGPGPYIFKINGQVHHRIGSLLPDEDKSPVYAQLYIYDTENEVENGISIFDRDRDCGKNKQLDIRIFEGLMKMFDETNELVKSFRAARGLLVQSSFQPLRLRLLRDRSRAASQYGAPTGSEIAALIVGDFTEEKRTPDIIVQDRGGGLRRISNLHSNYMALQYPVHFPYGEEGFKLKIKYNRSGVLRVRTRDEVTMLEYYTFRLQQRRFYGPPDLTFTCNTKWQEIVDALAVIPRQKPSARPDIVSRVFKLKFEEFISVLKKGVYFGRRLQ
ncbi:hypothetical protein U9M48_023503, partial [Paspalum notatum var. saurae]